MTDGSGESGRRPVLRGRQALGRTGARFARRGDDAAQPDDDLPETEAPFLPDAASPDPPVGPTGARFGSRARRARRARADGPLALPPGPSAEAPSGSASAPPRRPLPDPWPDRTPSRGVAPGVADPFVGRTGARFDLRARRGRRQAEREAAEGAAAPTQAAPVRQRVELGRSATIPAARVPSSGATWSDAWWAGARGNGAAPTEVHPAEPRRSDEDAPTAPLHLAELHNRADGIEPRVSVRPYVRTRGRTRARTDLRVETLVSIPSPRRPVEDPEHRVISELCDAPRSVAEVAAMMRVPLGVARILIGDMADEGTLTVHRTLDRLGSGSGPDRAVMARVLRGLRAL